MKSAESAQDEAETDADAVTGEDAEQAAPSPGEPQEARRKRGRPPGLGKVPGSGRQALPKTPADLRAYIVQEIGKADRLLAIARGDELRVSGPTGKSMLAHPTVTEQLRAWEILLRKVMPDLQSTQIDANVSADIQMPEAGTRPLARVILGILSTASLEKVPARGEFIEAEEATDTEDAAPGEPGSAARSEGEARHVASPSPSPPVDDALASVSPPVSPIDMDEKIKRRCRELGIPYNEPPVHIPHNPGASKDEQPPAMSAEDKIRERLRENANKQRERLGLPRVASDSWLAEVAGVPERDHERRPGQYEIRPGAPGSEFNAYGAAQPVYIGDRGHYLMRAALENGDGRIRYWIHGWDGMRCAQVWGRAEAEAKIHELIKQGK